MSNKITKRRLLASGVSMVGIAMLPFSRESMATSYKKSTKDNSIKTRVASCNCGQLSATCVGPDPERISLCHCPLCQKQSGSVVAVQARFPKEQVTIKGKATMWSFPVADSEPVSFRHCASAGAKFYFCPVCASTVYYTSDIDSDRIGIKIGTFADPSFPAPKITGFEEYSHSWVFNIKSLNMDVVT